MPQPFATRRAKAPGAALINPKLIAQQRPYLALAMLEVINFWAHVESQTGRTITSIVETDVRPVLVELFDAPNSKRQREILLELAKNKLPPEDYECLEAIFMLLARHQKVRNRLVHHETGICPELEDAILLVDPRDTWIHVADLRNKRIAFDARESKAMSAAEDLEFMRNHWEIEEQPKLRIMVYKMRDFVQYKKDVQIVLNCFQYFNMMVSQNQHARAHGSTLLHGVPLFQSEVERLRAGRSTLQAAHPKPSP